MQINTGKHRGEKKGQARNERQGSKGNNFVEMTEGRKQVRE